MPVIGMRFDFLLLSDIVLLTALVLLTLPDALSFVIPLNEFVRC